MNFKVILISVLMIICQLHYSFAGHGYGGHVSVKTYRGPSKGYGYHSFAPWGYYAHLPADNHGYKHGYHVGLTGGIGTGKSTVVRILRSLDVAVLDADVIARQIVQPGRKAYKKITREFGNQIILDNGHIDRVQLGTIVFNDQNKRKSLGRITHPEISKQIFKECFWLFLKGKQFVVLDLPLLFETKHTTKFFNKIIVVSCDNQQQIQRLISRNDYSLEEAQSRINAQMPLSYKCQMADYVIDNNHELSNTRSQVEQIVSDLRSSKAHWKTRLALGAFFLIVFNGSFYSIFKLKNHVLPKYKFS